MIKDFLERYEKFQLKGICERVKSGLHNSLFENSCSKNIILMKSFLEQLFSKFELCKPHGQNCGTNIIKQLVCKNLKFQL